jgi:hypothetical protein
MLAAKATNLIFFIVYLKSRRARLIGIAPDPV